MCGVGVYFPVGTFVTFMLFLFVSSIFCFVEDFFFKQIKLGWGWGKVGG